MAETKIPMSAPQTCRNCRQTFERYTFSQAWFWVCPGCTQVHDLYKWESSDIQIKEPATLLLNLGQAGVLKNIRWTVVGFAKKKEMSSGTTWKEYTLFNPLEGYSFLSEYNGHWIHLLPMQEFPYKVPDFSPDIEFEGRSYNLYHTYYGSLVSAQGEFIQNLGNTSKTSITEWISPPYMLSRETEPDRISWFLGESISSKIISAAFDVQHAYFPSREGVGIIQVSRLSSSSYNLRQLTVIALLILCLLQMAFSYNATEELVYKETFNVTDTSFQHPIIGASFDVPGGTSSLELKVSSAVVNDWMFVGMDLINEETGDTYSAEKDIEFYQGYEDGESWAEGDQQGTVVISSIPGGRYHISITAQPNPLGSARTLTIAAVRDVVLWSNFWWLLGIMVVTPLILGLLNYGFELQRWRDSEHSPYYSDDDE